MTDQEKLEETLRDLGRRIASRGSIADDVMRRIESTCGIAPNESADTFKKRIFTMKHIAKYAAAIVVIAGVSALLIWQAVGDGGATIAWADVQTGLRQAETWSFTMTVDQGKHEPLVSRMLFDGKSRTREELSDSTSLIDWDTGQCMVLVPEAKIAYQGTFTGMDESPMKESPRDWVSGLKRIASCEDAESLGEKRLNGEATKGWRVHLKDTGEAVTIWADAQTAELVRVEFRVGKIQTVLSDFEYDRHLDAALFSMELPGGYHSMAMGTAFDASKAGLDHLATLLRIWASGNDGLFPESPLDQMGWYKAAGRYDWSKETLSYRELYRTIGQGFAFLGMNRGNWRYAGKGVKLGDADTPVFWYKPKGSELYDVIYGDLRIEKMGEEDLPKAPK